MDTSVLSATFSKELPTNGLALMRSVIDAGPVLSVITEVEARSWVNPNKMLEAGVMQFVQDATILPLIQEIVDQCVKIRRNRKIKTPDAIIAATAIASTIPC